MMMNEPHAVAPSLRGALAPTTSRWRGTYAGARAAPRDMPSVPADRDDLVAFFLRSAALLDEPVAVRRARQQPAGARRRLAATVDLHASRRCSRCAVVGERADT